MALDVDDGEEGLFPYHLSYRKHDLLPCLGTYHMFHHSLKGFCRGDNFDYCMSKPEKYAKLADREWVEW